MIRRVAGFLVCLLSALVVVNSGATVAAQDLSERVQPTSRIVLPVDEEARLTILHSTHPLAVSANDIGPLDPAMKLGRITLVLAGSPDQDYQALTLLDRQQTKGSPDYHHWLTPEEFGQKFGPSQQDLAQVTGWLKKHGFTIETVARSGRWIQFSGTSGQVETTFNTKMRQYFAQGALHFANASDISIPAALAPVVRGVLSLHDFHGMPALQRSPAIAPLTVHRSQPNSSTISGSHFITPGDLAIIYNLNPLYNGSTALGKIDGSGQVIAIPSGADINLSDVSAFQSVFGLPQNVPNVILNGLDPGVESCSFCFGNGQLPLEGAFSTEATLDVEYAAAIAPGATIDLVISGPVFSGAGSDPIALSSAFIVDQDLAPIISVSSRVCESLSTSPGNAFWSALWEQAAGQGISVFVAAGDTGAAGCSPIEFIDNTPLPPGSGLAVNALASTPFDTAVGGTEFNETINNGTASTFWNSTNDANFASALGYIPEMVWNDSGVIPGSEGQPNTLIFTAGGGGVSTIYSPPSYQMLSIAGLTGAGYPNRAVPDVALAASATHDPYVFCFSGLNQPDCQVSGDQVTFNNFGGGTSFSAPEFAGIMALINQAAGGRQGLANYGLYALAAAENASFASCNSSNETDPRTPPGSECVLNDITTGNNGVGNLDILTGFVPPGDVANQFGYNAIAGYDPASGLGSVNASSLVNAWVNLANGFQGSQTSLSASFNGTPLPSNSVTIAHGQQVSVTVTVSRQGTVGTPTGSVSLIADGGNLASRVGIAGETISGSGGTATAGPTNISNLPGGTNYNLVANFPGDGVFAGSTSAPIGITVQAENTSTALRSDVVNCPEGVIASLLSCGIQPSGVGGNTIDYGDPVLLLFLTATTTSTSGLVTAAGNVTFALNGTPIAAPIQNSGITEVGDCLPPFPNCLLPGQYSVTATYSGDGPLSYNGSSSAPLNITVTKGNPFPAIVAPAEVAVGIPFTLATQVNTGLGTIIPTGTVQFFDGNPPVAIGQPLTLSGGHASTQVTFATTGDHLVSVQYSGDGIYNAVKEAFVDVIAETMPFNFATNTTSQTIAAGGTATYNVDLIAVAGFAGQVSFTCSGAPGGATCTVSPNPANVNSAIGVPTTLTPITVTVSNTANARRSPVPFEAWPLIFAGLLAALVSGSKRPLSQRVTVTLGIFLIAGVISCGGSSAGGPTPTPTPHPTTNATLTVTGTSGGNSSSIMLSLTVTH